MGSIIDEILSGEKINCHDETHYRYYVILFWSPSDIRGIRIAGYFSSRKKEFQDKGLNVIGIMVPETEPEKKREYINGVLRGYEIDICSVIDSDLYLWAYFNNQFLPNVIIMDDRDNMLEESSGSDNIGSVEERIDEITGVKKTSLAEFWDLHFVDMKYTINREDFPGESGFEKVVYSDKASSVTLSGQWFLDQDGFPACSGSCGISLKGEIPEAFLAIESPKKDELTYDSGGHVRGLDTEGFNLIRLEVDKNSQLNTLKIKIGKGMRLYSVQF